VNEFGSVGIDGAIYKSQGIDVKEIPGGCMCCAAGVPLQVAVNRIVRETKPQRLLIEPSGLGHPKRVLDTLQGKHFQKVLSMRASICLIDPQHLSDSRYTTHENFIDQIAMADILVANKTDLCDDKALALFDDYANALQPPKQAIIKTQFAQLDYSLLDLIPAITRQAQYPFYHDNQHHSDSIKSAERDGYQSIGFIFDKETIFDAAKLLALFLQLNKDRIKAVIHTDQGWQVFNMQNQQYEIKDIAGSEDSRIEIIGRLDDLASYKQRLEERLKACVK
jgi:G3E family GTPase